MIRPSDKSRTHAGTSADRDALRRRVRKFTDHLNSGEWDKCFAILDPALRSHGKVDPKHYAENLEQFKHAYGAIRPWYVRISLHLDASTNKHDNRPFAFVYVIWQDSTNGFHLFRERWIKDSGRWFTRVTGLVAYEDDRRESPGPD